MQHTLRNSIIPGSVEKVTFGLRQSPGIEIVGEGGCINSILPPSPTTQSRELSRQPKCDFFNRAWYLFLLTTPIYLSALGGQPEVVKGDAEYTISGNSEVVRVSDKTILEYGKFNIEKEEHVKYEQPSSKSTLLCRIKGKSPSAIRGKLEANGRLLFVNPNGVFFSETAQVNVGSIIASTLDISNTDFLSDRFKFTLSGDAKSSMIINKGRIEAAHDAVFLAPRIVNEGVIVAKTGKVVHLGAEMLTLSFDGDDKIQFAIDVPLSEGFIEEAGELSAGEVFMKLPMAQHAITSVLNVTGIEEAGHIEIENGVIRLKAGSRMIAKSVDFDGRTLHLQAPLAAEKITTHMTGEYLLSSDMKSSSLTFDAPVDFDAPQVSLSTVGDINFLKTATGNTVSLSADAGNLNFHDALHIDTLNIHSAHNVTTASLNVGTWTQENVTGTTTVGGNVYAARDITLQGDTFNIAQDLFTQGTLSLSGKTIHLAYAVDAGSIRLEAKNPIHVPHRMTAHQGDFVVKAPLVFDAPETTLETVFGKNMCFEGPLSGNTHLTLNAPEGEIILKGPLKGATRFKQVTVNGKKITQHEAVVSTGPVHYAAGQIQLGNDIITDNAITLDGPVTLFKNNAIILASGKYNKGPILLTSTLDADKPTRSLTFHNESSRTQIKGAIGRKGPLGDLIFNSGDVVLHDDLSGARRLKLKSKTAECRGSTYSAGEQEWNTGTIRFTHEGDVTLSTAGDSLVFGKNAKIELDNTKSFTINTHGGTLDLVKINSDYPQPITITTGSGEAHLHEIGSKVTQLHVEGKKITFNGHVEADQIFMEAENYIEYAPSAILTALQASGSITLNAQSGAIGSIDMPLKVETPATLFVGAETVAYLQGNCQDQYPRVYQPNPSPRTFFNGNEFKYVFTRDLPDTEEDPNLKTISPALTHKTSTHFISGVELKPRKAPIYYDSSKRE